MTAVSSHFVMVLVDVVIVRYVHLFLCSQISQQTCSVSGMWLKYVGLCKHYRSGVIGLFMLWFTVLVYYCNKNSLWVYGSFLFCKWSIHSVTCKFRIKGVFRRKTTPGLNHWTQSTHRYTKINFLSHCKRTFLK